MKNLYFCGLNEVRYFSYSFRCGFLLFKTAFCSSSKLKTAYRDAEGERCRPMF